VAAKVEAIYKAAAEAYYAWIVDFCVANNPL
jgi:hypothetical protein